MNDEHKKKFDAGVKEWNNWRRGHVWFTKIDLSEMWFLGDIQGIDFRDANLSGVDLRGACLNRSDLRDANLSRADLRGAHFVDCDLRGACLDNADLRMANLTGANLGLPDLTDGTLRRQQMPAERGHSVVTSLKGATLAGASLKAIKAERVSAEQASLAGADLRGADLRWANLRGANLNGSTCTSVQFNNAALGHSTLIGANFTNADVSDCSIYGVSAWDIVLEGAIQKNLIITPPTFSPVVTDNIELAQFMYLLLNNRNIRSIIDTITTKMVLILGRFTPERKAVLDQIRDHIRARGGVPVLFDFDKPQSRDITETVSTLAHLSRMVIVDLTDAKSVPQELQATIPHLPSVQFQPICAENHREYSMFEHFRRYSWVNQTIVYDSESDLMARLGAVLDGSPSESSVPQV